MRELWFIHRRIKRLENKRGRPLLLGQEIDRQVQVYLFSLWEQSAIINSAIVIGCASSIVKNIDSSLLLSNGDHISFSKHWSRYMLHRMDFVKRRASTKAKVDVAEFESFKALYLSISKLLLLWKIIQRISL